MNNFNSHYPYELAVTRTYDEFDPVKSLRTYLDKMEIPYIFGIDAFYFIDENDRELARWVM